MDINFIPPIKKTEYSYNGQRINVRLDWVDCGFDNLILREVVEHPGAVVILPVGKDLSIILVKQYRHALGHVTLECPAGTREKDEEILVTAKRELAEEAKLSANSWKSLGILHPVPGFSTEVQELFIAKDLNYAYADLDPGEFVEVSKYRLDEVKNLIINNQITDAKTISAIFRAELMGYFS